VHATDFSVPAERVARVLVRRRDRALTSRDDEGAGPPSVSRLVLTLSGFTPCLGASVAR